MENINGYAICFNEWLFDKRIKSELNLLLLISSLCAEKGYCWASNKYFAEQFEIDEISVSRKIKKLEKLNHIAINYEKRGCEVIKREIRLTKMLTDDKQKCQSTINKNVKENIIIINNTSNNNNILFEKFWNLYDKKISKEKCKKKFNKLSEDEIEKIFQTLPKYILSTKDKKYRKNPETYLNNKSWNDEIIEFTISDQKTFIPQKPQIKNYEES